MVDETASIDGDGRSDGRKDNGSKRWLLLGAIVVLGLALGAAGVFWWTSAGEGEGKVMACVPDRDNMSESKCPPKGAPYVDGIVQKATSGKFTLQPIDGGQMGKSRELFVRAPDRPYIDVAHAQTHAALGQPVRVYTKRIGGKEAVIYMVDSPVLGMR